MRIYFDEKADALYLRLAESGIAESEEVKPGVVLDFNPQGQVVGVEILGVKDRVPLANLSNSYTSRSPEGPRARRAYEAYGRGDRLLLQDEDGRAGGGAVLHRPALRTLPGVSATPAGWSSSERSSRCQAATTARRAKWRR